MEKEKLLLINDADALKSEGIKNIQVIYRQSFIKSIISIIFKSTRDTKNFDVYDWITFKYGIINNLYEKDLCKIEFIR